MIFLGWSSRLMYSIVCCLGVLFAQANPNNSHNGLNIDSVTLFSKKFVKTITSLHYATAQKIVVPLPGVDQELSVDWGFSGSGYVFAPMPWVPVHIKSTLHKTTAGEDFNFTELGKALLQDTVSNQVKHASLLKWFAEDTTLSPIKVFVLKLFLLIKDLQQNRLDLETIRFEAGRLLIRLGLTDDLGIDIKNQPFSHYMPEFIKKFVQDHAPEILNIIDMTWTALTAQQHKDSFESFAQTLPRTVYACTFKTEVAASNYFESLKHFPIQNFINGSDIIVFSGVTKNHTPKKMPLELKDAAMTFSELPQLFKVTTNNNTHWIGYVANKLGMADTLKLVTIALLTTIKDYAATRNAILAQNLALAEKDKSFWLSQHKTQALIQTFLQTELGKESKKRLNKNILSCKNAKNDNVQKDDRRGIDSHVNTAKIDALKRELALDKVDADTAEEKLAKMFEMQQRVLPALASSYQAKINALQLELNQLRSKIIEKEQILTSLEQQPIPNEPQKDTNNDYLTDLRTLADALMEQGQVLPDDLAQTLEALEAQHHYTTQYDAQNTQTLHNRVQKQDAIAKIYQDEVNVIKVELEQRQKSVSTIIDPTKRKIENVRFTTLEKPSFDAYIKYLETQARELLEQNEKIAKLEAYRTMVASGSAADLIEDFVKECQMLETEVGWIVDNNIPFEFITNIFSNNPEISMLIDDIRSNNPAYTAVKERLFAMMGLIIKQSNHIAEYSSTYRYILAKIFPDFVPVFDSIIENK